MFFTFFLVFLSGFHGIAGFLRACRLNCWFGRFHGFSIFSISFGMLHVALQVIPHCTRLINVLFVSGFCFPVFFFGFCFRFFPVFYVVFFFPVLFLPQFVRAVGPALKSPGRSPG